MFSLSRSINQSNPNPSRRQRIHELLIALIQRQDKLELIDPETPILESSKINNPLDHQDPAQWLDRNRKILNKYQALVRSAVTLDALLDSEDFS